MYYASKKTVRPATRRTVLLWARSAGELAANLSNLLNVGLLGLIPAARGHFTVDLRLHVQTFAQRTVKCLVDIRRIGFDGTVQIEVADALGRQKKVFHDFLVVVHCAFLLIPDPSSG